MRRLLRRRRPCFQPRRLALALTARRRLDLELVRRGLAPSREAAQAAIVEGRVTVRGAPADKAARLVGVGDAVRVASGLRSWASRGAYKLEAGLDRWAVDVAGCRCIDAGASTGGFTDVLLSRGAAQVWAVDVGRGQLLDRLRRDPRVVAHDRTNVRLLGRGELGEPFDVVVADLSFISLRTVAPVLARNMAAPLAQLLWLVKPQFEAGRRAVAAGHGVIREPAEWRRALLGVGCALQDQGAAIMGAMPSPLRGADGNVEFLVWAVAHAPAGVSGSLDALVDGALDEVGAEIGPQ